MINWLLTQRTDNPSISTAMNWKQWYLQYDSRKDSRITLAIKGGFHSQNVACAFFSGYQMAIRELLNRDEEGCWAFCVSEEKGNHPKNIHVALQKDNTLMGEKKYVAGASQADKLIVIVRPEGEQMLKAVIVEAHQDTIHLEKLAELKIMPEVPHGKASFHNTEVLEVLSGDGHQNYSKTFSSIEDIYISAAMLGFLIRIAREYDWPSDELQKMLLLLELLNSFGKYDPLSPELHILQGAFSLEMSQLFKDTDALWKTVPEALQTIWQRDGAIIKLAGKAKEVRRLKAWQTIQLAD